MNAWSPFRGEAKPAAGVRQPRSRGRRRQRLLPAAQDPDAVLSDRDAARAAEAARQARSRPSAPAWERFGSHLARPPAKQHEIDDGILRLAEAACAICSPVVPADTRRRGELARTAGARRDYGTGPAYEPRAMR